MSDGTEADTRSYSTRGHNYICVRMLLTYAVSATVGSFVNSFNNIVLINLVLNIFKHYQNETGFRGPWGPFARVSRGPGRLQLWQ